MRGLREVFLSQYGRVCRSEVVSEFGPKPGPRCRDREITHWVMSTQVKANKKVINFLQPCGNQNLMYLLEPARLQQALAVLDTDRDGQIDASEWC